MIHLPFTIFHFPFNLQIANLRIRKLLTHWKLATGERKLVAGQSLFEVVVALAISALVIAAIVSLATNSIRNSTFSKNQSLATTYVQQATEWLRGQRDSNVEGFVTTAGLPGSTSTYCLPDLTDLTSLAPTNDPTSCDSLTLNTLFTRYVVFKPTTSPEGKTLIETDVKVSWADSQGTHEVTSATNFTDWRQR